MLAILYSSLQWTDLWIKSIVCLCLQDPFVAVQSHNVTEWAGTEQRKKDRKYIKGMWTITCCNYWSWNCSLVFLRNAPQWPPLLIMELDVAFWHIKFTFGSPVSILLSKLNNSQLVRNCVALTHRNFDGYFYRKKCVLYTGKYGSKPLDTLCCWFMLFFFNLLLGLLQD